MPVFEWEGKIRVTIGAISRAGKLDLFRLFHDSQWYDHDIDTTSIDDVQQIMDTDAMVAVISTRKIEICQDGNWIPVKSKASVEHEGETIVLSFPPDHNTINQCPSDLGDKWIEIAIEKNGGLNNNFSFFTSVNAQTGKTNNEPKSEKQP